MIVTLKLWDDEAGVWNNDVAAAYGRDLADMNDLERKFLKHLEYDMFLTPEQVFLFAVDCKFARLHSSIPSSSVCESKKKDESESRKRRREIEVCAPISSSSWVFTAPKQQKC